ncbi:MAG: FtsQ-type POTRA domain-containing protein [Deltaproteobacteria bacterium]|nr:FtsQ-type POTRA domain-containing protein [Deltaproteobacteria bacterium]
MGTLLMGVLDRQSLRGETKNRKLGKERLAMRDKRRIARDTGSAGNVRKDRRMLTRMGASERRRPARGMRDSKRRSRSPRRTSAFVRAYDRVLDLAHGLGRLLLFVLLVPPLMLRMLLRPSELVGRVKEAPTRLRATAKRVRLESRDPGTVAGKAVETGRLAVWFLEEELADMRDGIPTAEEVRDDLRTGSTTLLDQVAHLVGLREREDGLPVGERLGGALAMGVILGVVGVGLFVAVFNGIEELKVSDHLALQTIDVVGLERVSEDDILVRLGARAGDNMLEFETASIGAAILDLPWVDSIEVERNLAGRSLEVRVLEHKAALLVPGERLELMDDRGRVFKAWEAGEPFDLPLLTADGELPESARKGALDVLNAVGAGRALGGDAISEIRWDATRGYSVVTRRGLPVHLGQRDFASRLDRVERAVLAGRLPLDAVASVDAGLRDRVIAVPRKAKRARRAVKKVIESQPTPRRDRARLLHLKRIVPAGDEALFFDDNEAEL